MSTKRLLLERGKGDFAQRWYVIQRADGSRLIEHQWRDAAENDFTSETQSEAEFSKTRTDEEVKALVYAALAEP